MTSSNSYAKLDFWIPDDYQIVEMLGENTISQLYLANDIRTYQRVVLKCFRPHTQGTYLREVAAALAVKHPNIISCLDTFYLNNGRGCIVYEYLSGGTLRNWLEQRKRVDLDTTLKCLEDLLKGLIALHEVGIIHCDIKPENIFLQPLTKGGWRFVLGDLGAASPIREASKKRYMTGTPAYTAPERLYEHFSYNCDLYSIGIVGFELVTGHHPFFGSTKEIYCAHLSQLPAVGEIQHPQLRDLIEKLLEKNPRLRIANAKAALHILRHILYGDDFAEATAKSVLLPHIPALPPQRITPARQELRFHSELTVSQLPQTIFTLQTEQQFVIGLRYEHYLELQSAHAASLVIIVDSAPPQMLVPSQIAYATQSRVFVLDLAHHTRTCIYEGCDGILAFHLEGQRLFWHTTHVGHICNLADGTEANYRSTHYLLNPQVHLLANGYALSSGGALNERLIVRDSQAIILKTWVFNGPIIALTSQSLTSLALTLNISESTYSLWRIELNPDTPSKEITRFIQLPKSIEAWCVTAGYFFWICDHQLWCCGSDLEIHLVGLLPTLKLGTVTKLHVSMDHRFVVTAMLENSQTRLVVWQFPE